jgi:hypothetical protein
LTELGEVQEVDDEPPRQAATGDAGRAQVSPIRLTAGPTGRGVPTPFLTPHHPHMPGVAMNSSDMSFMFAVALVLGVVLLIVVVRVLGRILSSVQSLLGTAGRVFAGMLFASTVCGVLLTTIVLAMASV